MGTAVGESYIMNIYDVVSTCIPHCGTGGAYNKVDKLRLEKVFLLRGFDGIILEENPRGTLREGVQTWPKIV